MMWTLELPYTAPPLSLNKRMHWGQADEIKQQISADVYKLATEQRLPKGLAMVRVSLHWLVGDRRRRDVDNPAPTLKAVLDGLCGGSKKRPGYGLTVDDDHTHVMADVTIEYVPKAAQRLWITITDLTPGGEA